MKQEKAALKYISALTRKRIKALVKGIAEDLKVMRDMDRAVTPDQLMLAELLMDSRTAKKLLNEQELSSMKKTDKRADGDFHVYISKVKKYFDTVNTIIWVCIGICASGSALLW